MTREEQIDWLCRLRADLNNGVIFTPWNKEFIEALNDMLEQEPKTGHWIEEFNDIEGEVRFTCSSCGKYQLFGTDFCYHCGSYNGGASNGNE